MFSRQRTYWHQKSTQRLVSLLLVVSMCASILPIPLAAFRSGTEKDFSQPFPCQNRPCGCSTAKQCWESCCCFSDEQKIAWAQKNQVTLPASITERVKVTKKAKTDIAKTSACSTELPSCCAARLQEKEKLAQTESREQHDEDIETTTPENKPSNETHGKYVIGIFAQKCQGKSSDWSPMPWSIISEPMLFPCFLEMVEKAWPLLPLPPAEICHAPPVPPPQSV